MKPINFIKTVPPEKQHAMEQWFTWSLSLLIISLVIMSSLYIKQQCTIHTLKKNKAAINHFAQEYAAAEANKQKSNKIKTEYEQQLHIINTHIQNPKNPHPIMQSLITACAKNNVSIQSIKIHKHQLSLRGLCAQSDQALSLSYDLNQLPHLENSLLVSIEQPTINPSSSESPFACTITSTIKKEK